MSSQRISASFKLEYNNSSGRHDFSGAHYRIVDKRGTVLRIGKANKDGETELVTVKKGEPIYIELKDLSTNTWESASPRKKMGYTPSKSGQSATVVVSNCYFQAKLMASKWVNFKKPWNYEVIFEGDGNKKITLKGVLDKEGKTKVYDSQKMPMAKNHENTAIERFQELVLSKQPNVKVIFIEPNTGERFHDSDRVIPIGADKKYREFQVQLAASTTMSIQSKTQLQEKKESRTVILDIDITAGATYTITREDNAKFFDNKLTETKKSTFKDGTPHTVYIPKKYNGKILLKKGSKVIAKFPLEALDPNKKNAPIVFCLSNKSTNAPKRKVSVNDIDKTYPVMWHFETKESLAEGFYEFDENSKGSTSDLKKIANTIFGSMAFDGVVLPTVGEAQNALRANNRGFIYDAFRKLKVNIDDDDLRRLRFAVKKSKNGKMIITFKGWSGLRSFINNTHYALNNAKVGMISAAATVSAAVDAGSYRIAGATTVKAAGRSLGGFGFALVATFEIAEFMLSDDPINNWSDLYVSLGMSAVKTVFATAVGVAIGAVAVASGIGIVVIVAGIGAAVLTSFALEYVDRRYNVTEKAQNIANYLESSNLKYLEANKKL